jgi:chemotaxis methyl-accepting protein methylase
MQLNGISELEFAAPRDLLAQRTGVVRAPGKQSRVCRGGLQRVEAAWLDFCGTKSSALLPDQQRLEPHTEQDRLTTDGTAFCREPGQFEPHAEIARVAARAPTPWLWSAVRASDEEVDPSAMALAERRRTERIAPCAVRGCDMSTPALATAGAGHDRQRRAESAPTAQRRRHCPDRLGAQRQERLR